MGGLLRHLPFIGTVMIMAMLAGCGLPGFANFPGEVMVLFGSWDRFPLVAALAIWGALVIGGVYMLRAIRNIWHGEKIMAGHCRSRQWLAQAALWIAAGLPDCAGLLPPVVDRQHRVQRGAGGAHGLRRTQAGGKAGQTGSASGRGQGDSEVPNSKANQMNLFLIIPEMCRGRTGAGHSAPGFMDAGGVQAPAGLSHRNGAGGHSGR